MVERDATLDTRIERTIADTWTASDIESTAALESLIADVTALMVESDADSECCNCVSEAVCVALTTLGVTAGYVAGNFVTDLDTDELTPHGWAVVNGDELPAFPYTGEIVVDATAGQFEDVAGFAPIEVFEAGDLDRKRYAY